MSLAKLTSKRQVTIPKPICDHLDVDSGDMIDFVINDEGQVVLIPKTKTVEGLLGMVKTNKSATTSEMKQSIKARMQKRYGKDERD